MFIFSDRTVAFMELKSLTGSTTPEQDEFIAWCDERKIPCPVISDIDNALLILRGWRVLRSRGSVGERT